MDKIISCFNINKTYDGYDLVINLNSTEDVIMDGLRCDPLFQDSFTAGNLNNWTTYSVTGAQEWYYNTFEIDTMLS